MSQTPDNTTWFLFTQGDISVFSAIFKNYYPALHNYGVKISNDQVITEDCLQEFFIYLYEHRENLGSVSNVKAYLFVSFRRRIFKRIKEKATYTSLKRSEEDAVAFEFSPEELAIQQEYTAIKNKTLALLLTQLSPRQKEVIYLKYYCELQTTEISDVMNISYQSVLNTLQKAFVNLRAQAENTLITSILK